MPDGYKDIKVESYLLGRLDEQGCIVKGIEWNRVREEYAEFEKRGLVDLLKYMIYLVDYMRENNIVWGVGRGSSVSSYVLFLIGVHKIDSLKYNLDWREFLRD